MKITVDDLAQEIRRVDGGHTLGAGALAEALMPFIRSALVEPEPVAWRVRDYADGWIIFKNFEAAKRTADDGGALIEPLYAMHAAKETQP